MGWNEFVPPHFSISGLVAQLGEQGPYIATIQFYIWACSSAGRAFGSHPRGRGFESLQVHQTRFGRTPTFSVAVSPCSVRSDPQQKSAVLEVIPRRCFFAIRTFAFCYFSCYNDCRKEQEVIQIHFFPYTVRPCATGADFLAGVKFPYISIKGELQKLRLIPHKFPLFFGILPKKRNKNLQTGCW